MIFNDKIDVFMKENGYKNLKQLAEACDIPYTTLRDFYEKKSADNSRLVTIRKLSKFMKCPLDYLAYDDIENIEEIDYKQTTSNTYFAKILYDKVKDLPEDKQKIVLNVTEAIINEIDDKLDQ